MEKKTFRLQFICMGIKNGFITVKMWLIGCLAWSTGDICHGKKDATNIMQKMYSHYTHSLHFKSLPLDMNLFKKQIKQQNSSDFCNSCTCGRTVKGHHRVCCTAVNYTSHYSPAITHRPGSLKCKYKHINVSMHAGGHPCQGFAQRLCHF